ncbi:MAG: RsmB/NOP family class I SAM-dependent RNA methyltransferase [Rhodobacteraceae bacterium]|nr:MAG: RsmB/NOP family class I SAM-dependent RNA methyltransferase [Paracoccaceae bacterium]
MTPGARVQAAAEILDRIGAGAAAEQALTNWARSHRFAGAKDRAAIRDLVFDGLRGWSSLAAWGGGETGRARMIGRLRALGQDPSAIFTGQGHAPAVLTPGEKAFAPDPATWPDAVRLDYPAWLEPELRRSLGPGLEAVMTLLRARAPVFLRVNLSRATRAEARAMLAGEGVETRPHPLAETALEVVGEARGLHLSRAYAEGIVEFQDVASQAVVAEIRSRFPARRVLDFCAGGGGKALAFADAGAQVTAHDADPGRMRDIAPRAERAGQRIDCVATRDLARLDPFDLVVADVPCSGSGAWRRQPQARWTLTQARLDQLCGMQRAILQEAAALVAPGGALAHVTCSLLAIENEDAVAAFLGANPDWQAVASRRFSPLEGGDGFFMSLLTRR